LSCHIARANWSLTFHWSVSRSLAVALVVQYLSGTGFPIDGFYGMIRFDGFALVFQSIFLVGAALAIAISTRISTLKVNSMANTTPWCCLPPSGMMFLACGFDLITLYISLELMALTFYVLVAFTKREKRSNEAAMKILSAGRVLFRRVALWYVSALWRGRFNQSG